MSRTTTVGGSEVRVSRRRGYTLIEALVVISIIVLLCSLLFPVFQAVKWQVKKSRSMSQMRQIHVALLLYVQDYEGGGPGGLGLPPSMVTLQEASDLPQRLLETGGVPYIAPDHPAVFTWMPPAGPAYDDLLEPWLKHIEVTQGNPIILIDETFNHDAGPFVTLEGHGIYLEGNISKRRARGVLARCDVWE